MDGSGRNEGVLVFTLKNEEMRMFMLESVLKGCVLLLPADRSTSVTVHPPKPPPVMRLPYTPCTPKAAATNTSNSSQLTSGGGEE